MICSPRAFLLLANDVVNCGRALSDRAFRSHFGCSPDICSIVWQKIDKDCTRRSQGMIPKHLLWVLLFLKGYEKEDVLACRVKTTRKTLRKWIWIILPLIAKLKRRVVSHL